MTTDELNKFLFSFDFYLWPMKLCIKFFFFLSTIDSEESDFCSGTSSILFFFIAACSAGRALYLLIDLPSIILVTLLDIDMKDWVELLA